MRCTVAANFVGIFIFASVAVRWKRGNRLQSLEKGEGKEVTTDARIGAGLLAYLSVLPECSATWTPEALSVIDAYPGHASEGNGEEC